jgi:predicted amidohydrolase YtcJ
MNQRDAMASSVTIKGDRIAAVGTARGIPKHDACARLIDLRGRTMVPGLIDSHDHIVQLSLRPGHDMRGIETSFSMAELQQALRAKAAAVPAGQWITSVGGWAPNQFAEKRLPTLAELDAAAPEHPVYMQTGFAGPAATNSKGKAFLQGKGVAVGADGAIAVNAPSVTAWNALKAIQTLEEMKRGAADVMAYAASVGLTLSADKGGAWPADTPGAAGGIALLGTGAANEVHPFAGYDPLLAVYREGKMPVRVRVFFYMQDARPEIRFMTDRLNNVLPDFGDDWLRVSGIGERATAANAPAPVQEAAARLIARKGWAYDQHANGLDDQKQIISLWEKVNATTPLAALRWCLAHVPGIDMETLNRLKVMGVGVSSTGGRYLSGTAEQKGSPFRMLLESGIHVGHGGDGGSVAPINPWPHLYYLVTGRNSSGEAIEPADQRLTRMQALRMYTANQGWFTKDEHKLGSIEVGKLADLVVLSDDFLDPQKVPDDSIRRITSMLTIVGGKIVHDTGALSPR